MKKIILIIALLVLVTDCLAGFGRGGSSSFGRGGSSGSFRSSSYSAPRSYSSSSYSSSYARPSSSSVVHNHTTVVHSGGSSGWGSGIMGFMLGSAMANNHPQTVVVQQPGQPVQPVVDGGGYAPQPMVVQQQDNGHPFITILLVLMILIGICGIYEWLKKKD